MDSICSIEKDLKYIFKLHKIELHLGCSYSGKSFRLDTAQKVRKQCDHIYLKYWSAAHCNYSRPGSWLVECDLVGSTDSNQISRIGNYRCGGQ